jgi:hypothetical protein
MATKRRTGAAGVGRSPASIGAGPVRRFSGAWATRHAEGGGPRREGALGGVLRTLDTLRHEEWKFFDDALVKEALIRLVGVADLIGAGLVRPVPNALGKTVFGYEKVTDMDEAPCRSTALATANDRQEFELNQLPLPITHKDFFINLRSWRPRASGEPLDTTQVRRRVESSPRSWRRCCSRAARQFGGMPIYGYTDAPDRVTSSRSTAARTGATTRRRHLVPEGPARGDHGAPGEPDVWSVLGLRAGRRRRGARQRLQRGDGEHPVDPRVSLQVNVKAIRTADQLPSGNLVVVQATQDVACGSTANRCRPCSGTSRVAST